jgi:hypothetical protein
MTIDERRQRLRRRLEEVLGPEEAGTLMDDLRAPGHEFELLRRDIQLLEERMDRKLAELKADLLDKVNDLLEKMNDQTKTLFRTFIVSNAAMVLAVATLAFGAARLA